MADFTDVVFFIGASGPSDITPPTIGSISPSPGAISRTQQILFTVTDETALGTVVVLASYATSQRFEVVYSGTAFSAAYTTLSSVVVNATSKAFTIRRDNPGWLDSPTLRIIAHDAAGNELNTTLSYTVTGYPFVPVLSASTPASGSAIARAASVSIPIADDAGIASVTVSVTYASSALVETVYNGTSFSTLYSLYSSLTGSSTSKTLTVRRADPGWVDSPTINVRVVDSEGNVTTSAYAFTVTGYPFTPGISAFSPVAGAVSQSQAISLSVSDDIEVKDAAVWVEYPTLGYTESIYAGSAFALPFVTNSTATPTGAPVTAIAFVLSRKGGWIDDSFIVHVRVSDSEGNSSLSSAAYTTDAAPAITNISPASNLPQNGTITFELSDPSELLWVFVFAKFTALDAFEVIWDGSSLAPKYADSSIVTPILTGGRLTGYSFVINRRDGWPDAPLIRARITNKYGRTL